jgi:hypothetical protein
MIKKIGTPFFLELNSHQKFFGATGFVTKIVDLSDSSISTAANDASEIVEVIDNPATSTVDAAAAAGAKQIVVQSGGGIADGMVFEDANGNKYYVDTVVGDTIHLKFPLSAGIGFGDTLTQVGNTGIYKIELTINNVGNFGIYVSNASINLRSKGIQYSMKDVVLEDVDTKIDTEFAAINSKLDSMATMMENSDSEDFTVFSG